MTWIEERKNIRSLLNKDLIANDCFTTNNELVQICSDFVSKWDENSNLDIIKKAKKVIANNQTYTEKYSFTERKHFSLSSYLNTIPFPKNVGHARLRNILLCGYDDTLKAALIHFTEEVKHLPASETIEDYEYLNMLKTGVEIYLQNHKFY